MSGHSHWAGIKQRKGVNDAKKANVFTKYGRLVSIAAKQGGGNPDHNFSLRLAIDQARSVNMPKDTIEKAIKKGTGETGDVHYEEVMYEGYAPGGVAIMVEALTDNRHRTGPEMRRMFEKHGGTLGTSGCVNWMFSKKGLITVKTGDVNEEDLLEIAMAGGADDMRNTGAVFEITCQPGVYEQLKKTLEEKKIPTQMAEVSMVPHNTVPVNDEATAKKILSLMEDFFEHDDVQEAYANFDIPDEMISKIAG